MKTPPNQRTIPNFPPVETLKTVLWMQNYNNFFALASSDGKENARRIKLATGWERGGADNASEATVRMDNLEKAREMEKELTIEEVKSDILRLFKDAVSGKFKGKSARFGQITKDGKLFLERVSGLKMKDEISFMLNPSDLVHIYKDHYGDNEKDNGNNIPLTDEDISNIVEIISRPEYVAFVDDSAGRKIFIFLKSAAEDGCYNLAEVYADRRGNLTAKSLYKTRKDVPRRVMALQSQLSTSSTGGAILSPAKVGNIFDISKGFSPLTIKLATGWERGADGK